MNKKDPTKQFFNAEINRRDFLKTSATAVAGLYGLNYLAPNVAYAAGDVKFLTWAHFISASDKELKRQAEEFSKKTGTKVTIDLLAHLQLPSKKASEAFAKSGHDIMMCDTGDPELYKDLLSDVSDLAEELGRAHGGWYEFAKDLAIKDGKWKGIPWAINAYPLVVRTDLLKKVGASSIDTYDDLLNIGRKLKKMGHPVGLGLSHAADPSITCHCVLWAFGGKFVEADSKTIAIDSAETAKALAYMKKLFEEAMDPGVLSWDDASNNRFILSGKGSIVQNPPSIYWVAKVKEIKVDGKPLTDLLDHFIPPEGPAGRFHSGYPWILGVWAFANNIKEAKDFLRFHFSSENFNKWIIAGDGYNMPLLREFEANPIFDEDPKYRFTRKVGEYTRIQGYPGKPTKYSQIAGDLYIIPDMFAYAASGRKSIPEAIKWAEKELKLVYAGQKTAQPEKK